MLAARVSVGLFIALVHCTVLAEEAPTLGLLYNMQESNSLTYRCEPVRAGQLTCDFVQTAVRFKATIAQLPSVIKRARQQYRSEKPPTAQDCGTFREIADVLEGKKVAPKPEAVVAMSQVERADGLRSTKLLVAYCDKPTEENLVAMVTAGHSKDRRTCQASSHTYKQSFRLAAEASGRPVWLAQSNPEGPCGIVQLSRFEPEETKIGTSKFTNWKYIARKAITNPSAELLPNAKCSVLDEAPYTYDWRSKEHQMSCDYIEFSPL